jgi:hypothetical protein
MMFFTTSGPHEIGLFRTSIKFAACFSHFKDQFTEGLQIVCNILHFIVDYQVSEWKELGSQRQFFNFTPKDEILPPGVNFVPYGWSYPLDGGETLCLPIHFSKHYRVFNPGGEWGVNIPLKGQNSPLGAKFTPRGKLHACGQTHVVKKLASDCRP